MRSFGTRFIQFPNSIEKILLWENNNKCYVRFSDGLNENNCTSLDYNNPLNEIFPEWHLWSRQWMCTIKICSRSHCTVTTSRQIISRMSTQIIDQVMSKIVSHYCQDLDIIISKAEDTEGKEREKQKVTALLVVQLVFATKYFVTARRYDRHIGRFDDFE